jgi:hypothetical protein
MCITLKQAGSTALSAGSAPPAQMACKFLTLAIGCVQADLMEMPSDEDEASSGESGSEFEDPAPPRGQAKRKPAARGTRHTPDFELTTCD